MDGSGKENDDIKYKEHRSISTLNNKAVGFGISIGKKTGIKTSLYEKRIQE